MAKFILSIVLFIWSVAGIHAQAKIYSTFEWDIFKVGYAFSRSDNISNGITISNEPRINISEKVSASIRFELAFFNVLLENSEDTQLDEVGSISILSNYYFGTSSPRRAFVGLGIGRFDRGNIIVFYDHGANFKLKGTESAGVVPQVGYELGHLRISAEYNYLFKKDSYNYFGIHLGLTLWGRYKEY